MNRGLSLLAMLALASFAGASLAQDAYAPAGPVGARVTAAKTSSAPASSPPAAMPPAAAPAGNLAVAPAENAPALPAQVVTASPASLKFGSLWNGDPPLRKEFIIKSVPRAGEITASIAGKSPFRIVSVRVWGDPPKLVKQSPQTSVQLAQPSQPSFSQPSGKALKASVSAAPFKVKADVKDQVSIVVDFAPKWSLSENAGLKSGKVNVTGFQWKSEVAVQGDFNGLKLGLAVAVEPQTLYAAARSYKPGQRFDAWPPSAALSVVNATGQPQAVALDIEPNGDGVLVNPTQVSLAAGEAKKIPLAVSWDPGKAKSGDYRARLSFAGKTTFANFHLEYLPFGRRFETQGGGWKASVNLTSGGEQQFSTECFLHGLAQTAHDCTFYFYRNGTEAARTVRRASIDGKHNDFITWTNPSGLDPEEVFTRTQAAWSVVEIDGKGDPDKYPKIPLVLAP